MRWLARVLTWGVPLMLALVVDARAAELEVKARIEPAGPYHVGDEVRFLWDVTHDAKVGVDSDLAGPLGAALQSAGFEGAGVPAGTTTTGTQDVSVMPRVEPSPAAAADGRTRVVLSAPVTTFTTGVHRVPSVQVLYHDAAGKKQSAQTPEMVVPVQSLLGSGKAEPKGVKAPQPYPWALDVPLWAWALLGAVIGLVGWAILRKRAPQAVEAPPPLPADEEALRRIDALFAENLIAGGHVKEFCDRLSDILRGFLGRRFGLATMGDTSFELIAELEAGGQLAAEDLERLRAFLEECDLAKFAKHRPEEAQLMGLVEAARGLVLRTRPEAPVAADAPRREQGRETAATVGENRGGDAR